MDPAAIPKPAPLQRQATPDASTISAAVAAADAAAASGTPPGAPPEAPPAAAAGGGGAAPPAAGGRKFAVGGVTDPGVPGKVNQDDFFLWDAGDGLNYVCGVFDGHGRELGQLAARVAKDTFLSVLCTKEALAKLGADPDGTMAAAFNDAHTAVLQAFRSYYEDLGWMVNTTPEGFLTRQRGAGQGSLCVHGGTTGTVIAVLNGSKVVISNVGDSSAILDGAGKRAMLRPISEWAAAVATPTAAGAGAAPTTGGAPSTRASSEDDAAFTRSQRFLELSADHSPESAAEFYRMREFRPCPHGGNRPELLFVYDTLSSSKLSCPPIYVVDAAGAVTKTGRGAYYKNVRNEWATLVATPPYAVFQDALAFTRSIGDLHLQTYGVSHTPETWFMDLAHLPAEDFAITMCSDGVWDNWKFEDVSAFVMEPARIAAAKATGNAEEQARQLMAANLDRAKINFGSSADNMTAVVMYITVPK